MSAPAGKPALRENWFWRQGEVAPGRAVIFDLDGVLSDAASRQHFIEGARPNWDAFFEACGEDQLIDPAARLLQLLDPAAVIVLLSGRPARVRPQTRDWLDKHALRWDLLVMRDYGDYSAAREFKRRSVTELREFGFDLLLSFEDDQRNVAMFRAEGVPCIYLHSGYYD